MVLANSANQISCFTIPNIPWSLDISLNSAVDFDVRRVKAGGDTVASQRILVMKSKRAEIAECIRLLEARARHRNGLAVRQLIESLRRRGDWLDRRIDLELQLSDSAEQVRIDEIRAAKDAA
jgi:hypothetical protein